MVGSSAGYARSITETEGSKAVDALGVEKESRRSEETRRDLTAWRSYSHEIDAIVKTSGLTCCACSRPGHRWSCPANGVYLHTDHGNAALVESD